MRRISERLPRIFAGYLKSPEAQAWLLVALVCTSVLGLTGWRIGRAYEAQMEVGRVTTANLARSLADHAHATVHSAGTIVSGIVERMENDGTSPLASDRLHRILVSFVAGTPGIRDLIAFTAEGDGFATSLDPMPRVNVADRAYFAFHRDHRGRKPLVGAPVRNRADGRWSFTVSSRIDNPDGSFGGVVVAIIDCQSFGDFYHGFDIGPHGSIWLMNDDATLVVREPPAPNAIGKAFEDSPIVREYRERGPIGSGQNVSPVDGMTRITSFRKMDDYPLVVFVSFSKGDILAGWRNDAAISIAVAIIIAAVLSMLGRRLVGQFRLRDVREAALRCSERQYRMLADHSTDIIIQIGPNGRRHYVSPACERLLGYRPSELLNGHPRETTHPDDWPSLAANLGEILSVGHAPPVSYRARRKDGVYLWVETQGRKLDGKQGLVVAMRDISSRKRVESLLHEANNTLQRQVMLDGLTGIANRRCFDLTFEKEVRRAARNQTQLGLLMIDVDHFKKFNDIYGHPMGDRCLRAAAETVVQQVRRPADFVARYGGEEFVVLLPDTDQTGATAMAERIRRAIQSLAIEHAGSPNAVVTVSIGAASAWPQGTESEAGELLQAADLGLYEAKARGRNGVCNQAEEGMAEDVEKLVA